MAGDSCLQQVSALLNSKTQGSDYIVRWSGDEFLLLLRDMKRDSITQYVESLCKAIAEQDFKLPSGKSIKLTSSMGWGFYPLPLLGGQIIGWETSINIADLALHRVKDNGRNGYATFTFDEQLDAFEFENSENIEKQLNNLLDTGLAKLNIWQL
jgi:diguanylate cyclase (GGDEF)-like protein